MLMACWPRARERSSNEASEREASPELSHVVEWRKIDTLKLISIKIGDNGDKLEINVRHECSSCKLKCPFSFSSSSSSLSKSSSQSLLTGILVLICPCRRKPDSSCRFLFFAFMTFKLTPLQESLSRETRVFSEMLTSSSICRRQLRPFKSHCTQSNASALSRRRRRRLCPAS